jgi:hypothetical protein
MFFFIGGVQPRTVTVDDAGHLCPACGLAQARLKRIDHYLSLFFIPIIPIKRGQVMLMCDRCGTVSHPDQPPERPRIDAQPSYPAARCPKCGASLQAEFRYCPQCGSRV